MTSLLLRHGVLHCSSHPFATALLVEDAVISWIGDDDTAESVAARADRVIELDGALVAPRFVDMPLGEAIDARGGAAAVRSALDALARGQARGAGHEDGAASRGSGGRSTAGHSDTGGHGSIEHDAGAPADASHDRALRRRRLSLVVDGAVPADVLGRLVRWGITLLVDLAGPGGHEVPLAALAREGVAYVLLPVAGESPWETTRRAVHGLPAGHGVSARAAFRAQTRAAWRLTGDDLAGELRVGQRAELSVWRAESVGVEDAASGVASWSTDARSGTPLLPVLGASGPLPVRELDIAGADLVSEARRP